MDIKYCISQLSTNSISIQQLLENITQDQSTWKPQESDWSILEVINHLYDEEKEDFRFRLSHLFSGKNNPWPKNNPQKWVYERKYNQREIYKSIDNFLNERLNSLEWLTKQDVIDLTASYPITANNELLAGEILSSWVAHDLLHLRQLIEIKFKYCQLMCSPYSTEYAGDW
jgi:hypothetical protein